MINCLLALLMLVALFVGGCGLIVWRFKARAAQTAQELAEQAGRQKEDAIRLDARFRTQTEEALPQIQAFERLLLQQFDCRPCSRCGELEMYVRTLSPNGRSIEVQCKHCHNQFRWKAVHPDTTAVSSAYRSFRAAIGNFWVMYTMSVPPNKFSAEGGREPIPQGVRQVVWRRDGGRCVQCGAETHLHFDHIIPVAKGGATTVENLQILCASCNLSKGARI